MPHKFTGKTVYDEKYAIIVPNILPISVLYAVSE